MFVAPSPSYVMPRVKCSSRTIESKDTLNQYCFQCNASSNMNQWHFFTCPAKFSIKISCFFSLEMQLSWSAYSLSMLPTSLSSLPFLFSNPLLCGRLVLFLFGIATLYCVRLANLVLDLLCCAQIHLV